ncbi:hypothetical protein QYE76_007851 [Lolium multiflorum]|uniref:Uncharacterized protein n=1 Tax=Lolium multiflorum TaxID=4521 RepID=A0AAD8QGM9_LOLMU|nr:hypothetical protein QYE76_007851 [Lolium multiflorum]
MPRAPPTPHLPDRLNFDGVADHLPIIHAQTNQPRLIFPSQLPNPTYSHPILGVNINTYIKFQVLDHVSEGAAPRDPDDAWRVVDIHISLWFMATLTDDLHRLIQGDDTAYATWRRLHHLFLDTSTSRYLFLSKAFRSTPRGDMSVATYASKLQGLADDLDAIGHPVNDCDLASQFVDGLGEQFKLQAEILKTNLPSFADCCSRIQMAEISDNTTPAQVYATHGGDRGQHSGGGQQHAGGGHAAPRVPGVSPNYRGNNPIPGYRPCGGHGGQASNAGRGRGHGLPSSHGGQQPNAMRGHDYGGAWPWLCLSGSLVGLLRARGSAWPAGSHSMDVHLDSAQRHRAAPLSSASPYSFDYNAMLHSTMTNGQQHVQQPEWIMDSGASSHITEIHPQRIPRLPSQIFLVLAQESSPGSHPHPPRVARPTTAQPTTTHHHPRQAHHPPPPVPHHQLPCHQMPKEIFSELDEINAEPYFSGLPEHRRGTRGSPGAPPHRRRGQGGAPPYGVLHQGSQRLPFRLYKVSASKTLKDKPRYRKSSRAAAIASQDSRDKSRSAAPGRELPRKASPSSTAPPSPSTLLSPMMRRE